MVTNQNSDGSWGYVPGAKGAFEPTAYAMMALRKEAAGETALKTALDFVLSHQNPEGGWAVNLADSESSPWVTSITGLALLETEGKTSKCRAAEEAVLRSFGKMRKPWILRIADWMQSLDSSYVDRNYGGWGWNPETARWVEPTSYSLIFLKKMGYSGYAASGPGMRDLSPVIREAESLIYQRKCKDGGWNYGNSEGLGEALRAFPLTTALALAALQDQGDRPEVQESLRYLKAAIAEEKSALALAVACLCFNVYRLETDILLAALADLFERTEFFRNIRTTALALLALETLKGRNVFRFEGSQRALSQV